MYIADLIFSDQNVGFFQFRNNNSKVENIRITLRECRA